MTLHPSIPGVGAVCPTGMLLAAQEVSREVQVSHRLKLSAARAELIDFPGRSSLSPREIDALAFLAQGFTNKGMAPLLGISSRTAEDHIVAAISKLVAGKHIELGPERNHRVMLTRHVLIASRQQEEPVSS